MTEAHIRIDEGIKRGPKVQRRPGPGKLRRSPQTGQVQAIPPDLDPDEVLARYLTEQTTSQIAQSYGITRKSLVAWLRDVRPQGWKRVQLIRAHDRKEFGNEGLESAADALSLARARELVRSAQWELQSTDPDYAPKQQVTVDYSVRIDPALIGRAAELLDQMRDVTPTNSVPDHNAALLQSDKPGLVIIEHQQPVDK